MKYSNYKNYFLDWHCIKAARAFAVFLEFFSYSFTA